jgi:hypothetical protein
MRFFSVDWLAALLVLAVLTAVPWLFGSGYIIGVMTVALCFAMWAVVNTAATETICPTRHREGE